MKIPILNTDTIEQLRGFFHPKDRSVILADDTFIEGEEVTTPANPRHNRGRLYWKNGCWTQLDESGNESTLCNGIWQNWTPTVDQGGAVAVTVNYARYSVTGDTVTVRARVTVTGAGIAANAISINGIPAAVDVANFGTGQDVIGIMDILDSGTSYYVGSLIAVTATSWLGRAHNSANHFGIVPNFGLAAGDQIGIVATYER